MLADGKPHEKPALFNTEYQPKYTGPLAEDTAKVQALGKKYQQNAALLKRFQPGTSCPVCRRVLSQQEYPAFRQALQTETEQIVADGTQFKSQIAELQEMEQKSQSTFEQFKAEDIERYQVEIDALNQKREPVSYTHLDVYKRQAMATT